MIWGNILERIIVSCDWRLTLPLCTNRKNDQIDLAHKSHHAPVLYPTMSHFVTEMCTHVSISVAEWCIVGYLYDALWDLWNRSIPSSVMWSLPFLALMWSILPPLSKPSALCCPKRPDTPSHSQHPSTQGLYSLSGKTVRRLATKSREASEATRLDVVMIV